jgi:hypothetical protein
MDDMGANGRGFEAQFTCLHGHTGQELWKVLKDSTTQPGIFTRDTLNTLGRDSSVDIATRYGLDGSGIEFRWRRDFPHPSITALGPT